LNFLNIFGALVFLLIVAGLMPIYNTAVTDMISNLTGDELGQTLARLIIPVTIALCIYALFRRDETEGSAYYQG
jgi:hypothetical protein